MAITLGGQALDGWALVGADGHRTMSQWMDDTRVRHLHGDGPAFWFSHAGREYVIRDAAVLAEIERAFAPMGHVGRKMGEVGRQQGAIGRQQGELGRVQARLARRAGPTGPEPGPRGRARRGQGPGRRRGGPRRGRRWR